MGIERLEPTIPRKDLDRRVEALRKTPFQNTAKRFKFQTLVQRYTSLQQYWYRTCRDIENGTYRKHLMKARRRFESDDNNPIDQADERKQRAELASGAKEKAEADLASLLDDDVDLSAEFDKVIHRLDPPAPNPAPAGSRLTSLKDLDDGASEERKKRLLGPGPSVGGLKPLPRVTSTAPRPLGAAPPPNRSGPSPSAQPSAPKPSTSPRTAAATKESPQPRAPQPQAPPPRAPQPQTPPPRAAQPQIPARGAQPQGTQPQQPRAPQPQAPPPRAAPPQAPPRPAAAAAGQPNGLSEDRIRAIHAQYQRARAETQASAVSFEKLQRNIRETENQLRAKHRGRDVDFDVTIKDGKAILKPRLK